MLDWFLIFLSLALGGADGDQAASGATAETGTGTVVIGEGVAIGEDVMIDEGVPGQSDAATAQFEAEPQSPTGKFTTATEVKPILSMTKANWVAVREYDGQDLLYVTHLWAWRCGLLQMRYSINDGALEDWPLPPCHEGTNAPNAIIDTDGLPYASFALGGVQSVTVELLFDDLSTDSASWSRPDILMP